MDLKTKCNNIFGRFSRINVVLIKITAQCGENTRKVACVRDLGNISTKIEELRQKMIGLKLSTKEKYARDVHHSTKSQWLYNTY